MSVGRIPEGRRNDALFAHMLRVARTAESMDALLQAARAFNRDYLEPPLLEDEVERTAGSAWRYQREGRNFVGQGGVVLITHEELDDLLRQRHGAEAVALLALLRRQHGARQQPFAVSCDAMAAARTIACWPNPRKYRRARNLLHRRGHLELVSPSGTNPDGTFRPAQWRHPSAKFTRNRTNIPAPCPRGRR
ncbi:MAG: primase C-terminal domain-containing protein [Hyphomicrobiaceae bacterium]